LNKAKTGAEIAEKAEKAGIAAIKITASTEDRVSEIADIDGYGVRITAAGSATIARSEFIIDLVEV
jgi:TRAP-type uncharacterized transport system substrate-binding protein